MVITFGLSWRPGLAPPSLAFNQIGLSLVRWTAAGRGVVCVCVTVFVFRSVQCVSDVGGGLSYVSAPVPKTSEECLITCSSALFRSLHPPGRSVVFHPAPPPQASSAVSCLLCASHRVLLCPPLLLEDKQRKEKATIPLFALI